jgi:protein SCO1
MRRVSAESIRRWMGVAALAAIVSAHPGRTLAQFTDPDQSIGVRPELLKDVGVDQKLNSSVPLDLVFRDEHGKAVALGQYFHGKPVILTLIYYNCPMLCTQVLNGLDRSLEGVPLNIGRDFEVVTVSIDPTEQPSLAEAKQAVYLGMYNRPGAVEGWHFLVGDEPSIEQLARAVGFRYAYDPDSKQYAHASVIMLLTPEGKLSRYFYGVTYPARDIRLGLVDASGGKIGSPVDQVLLFCYHYDPHTGRYGLLISRVLQLSGLATLLIGGVFLIRLFRGEHYSLDGRRA